MSTNIGHDSSKRTWTAIKSILENESPFQRNGFSASTETFKAVQENVKLLVIGAGGLGCELLKNLALSGFSDIHVIDMDIIDLSNLNRQFLFRPSDIGKPKADIAAKFIEKRVSTCKVTSHVSRIEDMSDDFYRQFHLVISGLDSVGARRWINNMLANLVEYDDDQVVNPSSIIPLIDGGTEGFVGMARVIIYSITPCIECQLGLFPPPVNFPLCTIANTPRLPEHCIEYVRVILWEKDNPFGGKFPIDGDNIDHIQWIYNKSRERANEFNINGVTMRLTKGVIKRIIPAVASTNAVISAVCTTEVLKLVSFCYDYMNNYMNFSAVDGVYSFTFNDERKVDCSICGNIPKKLTFHVSDTLRSLIDFLKGNPELQLKDPSVTSNINGKSVTLYMNLSSMKLMSRQNLKYTLKELGLSNNCYISVADAMLPHTVTYKLELKEDDTMMIIL